VNVTALPPETMPSTTMFAARSRSIVVSGPAVTVAWMRTVPETVEVVLKVRSSP
jgi:hypothetical protein